MRPLTPLLLAGVLLFCRGARSEDTHAPPDVFAFMGSYCLECHDSTLQKGERDFELFDLPLENEFDLITAKEIIDQLTLREMPPKKADQPSEEQRIAIIRALRAAMDDARGRIDSPDAHTVIRRLSNREYENTLETLFGRRVDTLGLTADFPGEQRSHHMDNIGESLVTSGFLLDQYFQSAQRLVEARLGKPSIKPRTWNFKDNFQQYEELQNPHRSVFNFRYLCLYEQPNSDTRQGGYGHIEDFLAGVPVSGLYQIRVHVQAMHRDTHYDPSIFGIDFSEPFQLAVVPGDVTKGHIHYPQPIEPILGRTTVPDDKPEWRTFRVWLEAGQTPRFIFPNGPRESRASVIEINKRYRDEFKNPGRGGVNRAHILREGKLPHIRIGEIEIRGPLPEEGGSREEIAVFGHDGFREERALAQLHAFGERAFRRPLGKHDRDRIEQTYRKRLSEQASPRQAALDTVKMILCSPSFLYLSEVTPEGETSLQPYDLASRLSYALWAAPPDGELLARAAAGDLKKPDVLRDQVLRMLDDDRSGGFVEGFLDSWLNLRDIGNLPPPRQAAPEYYAEDLPSSMRGEARHFFRHLLDRDGPVTDFLDSDYTFVDKKLARLYRLPEKDTLRLADGFQRVSLEKKNHQRGGVLGMAGVLTVSANGVETSPVTRGVWVSENLLGIQPPPPPDEVPAIDSDVTDATTIRERLALHSADRTCAECHRKIDPLGFPLETFDPIGRWRTHYPKPKGKAPAPAIDSSGELASGETFSDFAEFKRTLVEARAELFARGLITKLLTYSTGRHMKPVDQFEIEEILEKVRDQDYGLRTMVVEVMTSEIFCSR